MVNIKNAYLDTNIIFQFVRDNVREGILKGQPKGKYIDLFFKEIGEYTLYPRETKKKRYVFVGNKVINGLISKKDVNFYYSTLVQLELFRRFRKDYSFKKKDV